MKICLFSTHFLFCDRIWYFYFKKKIGSGGLFFKTKDTKKAKTEDKEVSEDGVQAPEKTANSVEKLFWRQRTRVSLEESREEFLIGM